jgi:hypothetical protein
MIERKAVVVLGLAACALGAGRMAAAQDASVAAPAVGQDVVQRFDPINNRIVDVPPAEIKPGFLYNHYHAGLGRRVWSVATPDGGFLYAMAPGSVQPARALDLRATEQQLRTELIQREPELAKLLDIRGGTASVRLTPNETWEVVAQPTISSVFDLETGRRWEWHGRRRVAVVHTYGYEWTLVDGRFMPSVVYAGAPGCW